MCEEEKEKEERGGDECRETSKLRVQDTEHSHRVREQKLHKVTGCK